MALYGTVCIDYLTIPAEAMHASWAKRFLIQERAMSCQLLSAVPEGLLTYRKTLSTVKLVRARPSYLRDPNTRSSPLR